MDGKVCLELNIVDENGCELTEKGPHLFQTTNGVRWKEVTQWVTDKLSLNYSLAFSYFDEEGDLIFGNTEQEWKEVLGYRSKSKNDQGTTVAVNILVLGKAKPSNCCQDLKPVASCCSSDVESKPSCCEFLRPIPPIPDPVTGPLVKKVNPLLSEFKYRDEALRAVTLPLGPIGGGSIALAGDGGLRQWQITNTVNHDAHVPDSFFAIRVDQGGTSKAVVLQSSSWYNQEGFQPAAYVTDHVVPEGSLDLLSELPGIKDLEVTAKYPIAEVDFLSDEVPVKVHLEAFNPCIPLDSKNSGIPVIIFNYTVTNSSSDAAKVSLLGTLQNIAGWDGMSKITSEVECEGYGGNVNSLLRTSNLFGIDMNNLSLPEQSSGNGHVSLSVLTEGCDKLTTMLQFDNVQEMWKYFTTTGLPGQGKPGPSPSGKTWNGAVCCERVIQPNTSETFTFLLAWHFPHRYVNWSQANFGINDPNTKFYIGNQYSKLWKDIVEVLSYTVTNMSDLTAKTRDFRDAMFDSTVPWQMIDSAAGRVSVVRSPTCMWLGDGNLYGFEGCSKKGGCCPLNCTHVFNYEMAIAKCFPDLERTMRVVDMKQQVSPNGMILSRTIVPLELRRQWTFWPNYTDVNPASSAVCVDGEIGTVLKTYREILHGASQKWFDDVWPVVKKIMERWMTQLDNGDGLIPGPQPNTYDVTFYGVNTFTGTLYLCALRAAEEMAILQEDKQLADKYAQRFALGKDNLDKECYNNELGWYTQVVDKEHEKNMLGDATFVDCLVGQWWAFALQLGYLLPEEHIQKTLERVFLKNHVDAFNPGEQTPRPFFDQRDAGMYICRWSGAAPVNPFRHSCEGAWTSLEYEFAQLCLIENFIALALKVLTEAREKYDGTRRSPWNEIECGDHYIRPMAAFLFFEMASGQTWRLREAGNPVISLGFAPRINPSDFCGFFITGTAWGQFKQQGDEEMRSGTAKLCVYHGELQLSQLTLQSRATSAVVRKSEGSEPLDTTTATEAGKLTIKFNSDVSVKDRECLLITLSP